MPVLLSTAFGRLGVVSFQAAPDPAPGNNLGNLLYSTEAGDGTSSGFARFDKRIA
jgi:hypothetical protein